MRPTTVFVVEDVKVLRELLREVLGLEGYAVLTAASVPEAEAIHQRAGLGGLALVITDLRLTCGPDAWEGYALIQRWHAVRPALPFILISGDLRLHDLRDLPAEVVRRLAKPFETAALLTTVREAISHERTGQRHTARGGSDVLTRAPYRNAVGVRAEPGCSELGWSGPQVGRG